jgi:serine protease Do
VQASPDAAEVAAGDPWTDLAVLKIEAEGLPVMPFGDASALRRGHFVVALGNPYAIARDGQASASLGIVANLQRAATAPEGLSEPPGSPPIETSIHRYGTLIQTDAKLNLGSSGGALVNLQGEMVGLTTSLAAVAGYEQAAGYAIPIDPAMRAAIDSLRAGKQPSFGFLGIEPLDAPGGGGAVVHRVVPGMPADEAGLIPGDVIQAVEATPVRTARDLIREMSRRPANRATQLVVMRALPGAEGKGPETLTVRLGKKRLATPRPAYQSVPDPRWRGMQVDFATALPPQSLLGSRPASRTDVAVMTVTPDSPAWQAGVRAGQMIASVDGQPISDPAAFYRAVAEQTGTVPLQMQSASGRPQRLLIGPDAPADSDAPAEPTPPAPP